MFIPCGVPHGIGPGGRNAAVLVARKRPTWSTLIVMDEGKALLQGRRDHDRHISRDEKVHRGRSQNDTLILHPQTIPVIHQAHTCICKSQILHRSVEMSHHLMTGINGREGGPSPPGHCINPCRYKCCEVWAP
jgi:hypothetical protein